MTFSLCPPADRQLPYSDSPQHRHGKFHNDRRIRSLSVGQTLAVAWNMFFNKPADTVPPGSIPVDTLTRAQLDAAPDRSLFRLGHSTVLLKLRGTFWLTDPVFAERASPLQWLGPKRFHAPPISLAELPPIQAVILSHNHYDHLDKAAVLALADKTEFFLTPLGVGDTLIEWGIAPGKVRQFNWWQGTELAGVRLTATPAQHFSGRGLADSNKTLWASWVIRDDELRVFFSGDSGYFDGFKAIGDKYGPFDLTLMETGAYNAQWPDVHMQPEETLQAHLDLRGRWLLPIHNGTFDLSMHSWHEPFERITALAAHHHVALTTPRMGEHLSIAQPQPTTRWWRALAALPAHPAEHQLLVTRD
ncbi:hydrolase [Permianibacter sp. IMCC34836]|uniref:MBL fold metallo-hydrolase n=1 Tax=Permianibacter fluminis TaxID=2738515 RepID=UPI0015577C14|nr:MBL fold metallo-hydrolase [Permianibacter fluminis]NQD36816.1 hydrolase [Permianibacter fluminis]